MNKAKPRARKEADMPGGDGTGPMGTGARIGRAAGLCAGSDVPGYMNPGPPRGFWGYGGGRGRRNRYHATGWTGWLWEAVGRPWSTPTEAPAREGELDALKRQSGLLEGFLAGIRRRIEELESRADNA
jgi:hypothetical protein